MAAGSKVQVLFICTGNSARSQMAEGLLRRKAGDVVDIYSAGTEPAADVHPLANRMMSENGIDPSGQRPKSVNAFLDKEFDVIVTTCDGARETCPFLPGDAERYHWGLRDPAAVEGDEEERLTAFRETFTEISERVTDLVNTIGEKHEPGQGLP